MLDKYLRQGETIESRLDDCLDTARRTNNTATADAYLREALILATLYGAGLNGQNMTLSTVHMATATAEPLDGILGEVYTPDMVAKALDNAFEGGQAPVALKGAVLAILGGAAHSADLSVSDSVLLPPLADGSTPMVEGDAMPYIDASGVDFDQTMPDTLPEDAEPDEDFPEFAQPKKTTKKGGKKTAAQRAAEEAGL